MINVKKVVNDLVGYDNLKIVQHKDYFNFSLESVLLPNFVTVRKTDKKLIDLGCGNAPMPLILNYLYPFLEITGVELQEEIYNLAIETLKINNKEDKINLLCKDIKDLKNCYKSEEFDIVVVNPPYFPVLEGKKINNTLIKSIARHEIKINLQNIIEMASYLLKNKGKLAIVHITERLPEVLEEFKKYNIEPKRLQLIYAKKDDESNLFLLEGVKNTGKGLKVLSPLVVHNENGEYSEDIKNKYLI